MAEIFYSDNPLEFTKLEGVIVSEKSPIPSVIRAGANAGIFIAQFEKGPANSPKRVSSIDEMQEIYGDNPVYGGNKALRLKGWSNLYVVRAVASDAVKATITQTVSTKDLLTVTAKYFGKYANALKVNIADGTNANTKKLTFTLGNEIETFDNLVLAGKTDNELAELFRTSKLVVVSDTHATDEPENADLTLATGSDGSIAGDDYKKAIEASNLNIAGKIYFTDDQSLPVKSALANFIKTERSGICILGPVDNDVSVENAVSEANGLQDQEGRVLYAYNPVLYNILGVIEEESPVFLVASLLNLTPPNRSISSAQNKVLAQTASRG